MTENSPSAWVYCLHRTGGYGGRGGEVTLSRYEYVFFDPNLLRTGKKFHRMAKHFVVQFMAFINFILLVNYIKRLESFSVSAGDLSDEDRQWLGGLCLTIGSDRDFSVMQ
jgi:hypothetical protein